ncbi:MAG: hypothetical protein ACK47B_22820 [Armatimonadota bacterium]
MSEEKTLTCDTCGKTTEVVKRVVVDSGYNRANARPLYNCPDCYEKKLQSRLDQEPSPAPPKP